MFHTPKVVEEQIQSLLASKREALEGLSKPAWKHVQPIATYTTTTAHNRCEASYIKQEGLCQTLKTTIRHQGLHRGLCQVYVLRQQEYAL